MINHKLFNAQGIDFTYMPMPCLCERKFIEFSHKCQRQEHIQGSIFFRV